MNFRKLAPSQYILRFDPGDHFAALFTEFLVSEHVSSAFTTGLGSFTEATIGFYDTKEDHYNWHTLSGLYEILSLTGNVATFDGKPVFHLHLVAGTHEFDAQGGHLKDMVIGATCELMLNCFDTELKRKPSSYKELKTLDI
ncbi:DNA-binding protein [Patescibacteria group bacterium]|nr:MAG: DNA-binding protein [Patescibacteria group bacterium]